MVTAEPVLKVRDLRAYYQMRYFGVTREVRAVDDITLDINRDEIYGLAGEFELGQDLLHQDDRRRQPAAAQRRGRLGPATASSTATFTRSTTPRSRRCAGSTSPTSCRGR